MSMPPGDGFTADIDEMDKAVKWPDGSLPRAISKLRDPAGILWLHEGFGGQGPREAANRAEVTYQGYCEVLAELQNKACNAMDATAQALREIVELYRRVDGRV
jgi:hypothetical protein